MRFTSLLLLLLTLSLFQCNSNTSATADAPPAATPTAPAAAAPAATQISYPSISQEKMLNLYENCDYIDFVFYSTNFSMSQGDQPAIRSTLAGVSTNPAIVLSTCQPIGRIFFQIDGVNAEEADIYYSQDCVSYIFLENGKHTYGNMMTESGFDFYKKVFAQVKAQ